MTTRRAAPVRRGAERNRRSEGLSHDSARGPGEMVSARRARPQRGTAAVPVREPRIPRSGPQTATRSQPMPAKSASQAKARAKARRAKAPKVVQPPLQDRLRRFLINRLAALDLRPRALLAKVPFVVLVIGSLGVGLGLTLWLSTDSAQRSYQLGNAREENRVLQQHKESLERDVLESQAAPALADAARDLGMIPTKDTAHLVQDPAGNWVVVGNPKPAEGIPPPPLNTKLPDNEHRGAPGNPVEVPIRPLPRSGNSPGVNPGAPPVPLLRMPDGSSAVGTEQPPGGAGLPAPGVPGLAPAPGVPGQTVGPQSGQLPMATAPAAIPPPPPPPPPPAAAVPDAPDTLPPVAGDVAPFGPVDAGVPEAAR